MILKEELDWLSQEKISVQHVRHTLAHSHDDVLCKTTTT